MHPFLNPVISRHVAGIGKGNKRAVIFVGVFFWGGGGGE